VFQTLSMQIIFSKKKCRRLWFFFS